VNRAWRETRAAKTAQKIGTHYIGFADASLYTCAHNPIQIRFGTIACTRREKRGRVIKSTGVFQCWVNWVSRQNEGIGMISSSVTEFYIFQNLCYRLFYIYCKEFLLSQRIFKSHSSNALSVISLMLRNLLFLFVMI
jgi:hypothetical protein